MYGKPDQDWANGSLRASNSTFCPADALLCVLTQGTAISLHTGSRTAADALLCAMAVCIVKIVGNELARACKLGTVLPSAHVPTSSPHTTPGAFSGSPFLTVPLARKTAGNASRGRIVDHINQVQRYRADQAIHSL